MVVIVACGMFLFLELGLRLREYFQPIPHRALFLAPDAELGWVHTPGIRWNYGSSNPFDREFLVPLAFDSSGLRGNPGAPDMDSGALRILMLGNSFLEALQVPVERTSAEVLKAGLEARMPPGYRRVQVFNTGVSSYGVGQYLVGYKSRWRSMKPSIVFAYVSFRQMARTPVPEFSDAQNLRLRPAFRLESGTLVFVPPADAGVYKQSWNRVLADYYGGVPFKEVRLSDWWTEHLEGWGKKVSLLDRHSYAWAAMRFGSIRLASYIRGKEYQAPSMSPLDRNLLELNMAVLDELRREVEKDGARLVVIDIFHDPAEAAWILPFAKACSDSGIERVDAGSALRSSAAAGVPATFRVDFHFNELGNRIVAAEMERYIREQSFLNNPASREDG